MLTKKKKISRKEIKEDKLVTAYYKSSGFIKDNSKRIGVYALIAALIVAALYVYYNNKKENNIKAGSALAKVMKIYDAGSYLEAIEGREGTDIKGLKEIVDQYGSTENGEIAKIYLANAYSFLGKHEEALEYYEDYSGGSDIFKATALAGEAGYYAAKNESEKAADLYLRASRVSESNVLNPEYLLKASINYLQAGEDQKAKELLQTIRKEHKTSPASREVDRYLVQIQ